MSEPDSPTTNNQRGSGGSLLPRVLIAIAALLALGLFCLCGIATYGLVTGEEFSPDTFEQRSFWYYEIPLVGLQVTAVRREDETPEVVNYLRTNNLLPVSERDEPRWHFARAIRGGQPITGDASILCSYLQVEQDGQSLWRKWSRDHPPLAAVLWPVVAELARDQKYVFLPDLLALATEADDAGRFRQDLNSLLNDKYRMVAANQSELEAFADAIDSYTKALARSPEDVAALNGRAAAYEANGQSENAASDRARAAQLSP